MAVQNRIARKPTCRHRTAAKWFEALPTCPLARLRLESRTELQLARRLSGRPQRLARPVSNRNLCFRRLLRAMEEDE
eukprot:SAG31_NODE_18152_length_645_cov_1.069597_1_plen_76_part_10